MNIATNVAKFATQFFILVLSFFFAIAGGIVALWEAIVKRGTKTETKLLSPSKDWTHSCPSVAEVEKSFSSQKIMKQWISHRSMFTTFVQTLLPRQYAIAGILESVTTASSEANPVLVENPLLLPPSILTDFATQVSPETTPVADPFNVDGLSVEAIHAKIEAMKLPDLKKFCSSLNKKQEKSIRYYSDKPKKVIQEKLKAYFA